MLGRPYNLVPWIRDHLFGQFWKLGFCSVSECEIFAHGGQICIFINRECVARVPTWNMPKHACMTYQNIVLLHSFYSMPRVGIQQVSLKACRRWDSMCDKIMVIARIENPLTPLDSEHRDSARGGPLLWVHGQGIIFVSILETRVLLTKGMPNFCT